MRPAKRRFASDSSCRLCRPLSFPISAWECVPAKLCFASAPVGDCIPDRNDPPPPNIPLRFRTRSVPCRHSGIFIPPDPDSGIVNHRWRNENIRNPLRHAVMSPHRSPAPLTPEIPPVVPCRSQAPLGNASREAPLRLSDSSCRLCRPLSFPISAWECVPAKLCFALLINPPASGFAPLGRFTKQRLGTTRKFPLTTWAARICPDDSSLCN